MTHLRVPGSIEDILHQVIQALPPDAIEAATQVSVDYLRQCSNPTNAKRRLSLEHAIALDNLLASSGMPARFLPAFQRKLRERRRNGPEPANIDDLHEHNMLVGIEQGQHLATQMQAFEDKKLDMHERRQLAKEQRAIGQRYFDMAERVWPAEPMRMAK